MNGEEDQDGEAGEVGLGSVLRLRFGGFRGRSMLRLEMALGFCSRSDGTTGEAAGDAETEVEAETGAGVGAGRNSSIRSVSGTGSILRLVIGGWKQKQKRDTMYGNTVRHGTTRMTIKLRAKPVSSGHQRWHAQLCRLEA